VSGYTGHRFPAEPVPEPVPEAKVELKKPAKPKKPKK
jgi:hypothetical protein